MNKISTVLVIVCFLVMFVTIGCTNQTNNKISIEPNTTFQNEIKCEIKENEIQMYNILNSVVVYKESGVFLTKQNINFINYVATWLRKNPGTFLIIEGHGTKYDTVLIRVETVRDYLRFLGINPNRLITTIVLDNYPVVLFDILLIENVEKSIM